MISPASKRELCHHSLDLPILDGIDRHDINAVAVWDDDPRTPDALPRVTVQWRSGGTFEFLNLLPGEARALAAMLEMAADGQDRRAMAAPKAVAAFSTEFKTEPPAEAPAPAEAPESLAEAAP